MRMQVLMPILKGMMWQMIGSLLVTIMLLLSIAYLIKVMLLQKKVDKMRSDFVHIDDSRAETPRADAEDVCPYSLLKRLMRRMRMPLLWRP